MIIKFFKLDKKMKTKIRSRNCFVKKEEILKTAPRFTAYIFSIFFLFLFSFTEGCYCVSLPKKIMFIVHTETIGGKGVYDVYKEMKNIGHDVKIIAIPSFYGGKLLANVDLNFANKFNKEDVIYPCGKKSPYKRCENIESYKADYLFIQNPYDTFQTSILDPNFRISNLKKIAKKIAYIVYGPHLFHQDSINDTNLDSIVDTVFVDSESTKEIYIKRYKFPKNRIAVSGYQPYKEVRDTAKIYSKKKKEETILWLPRWSLGFKDRDLFEGGSTFLNYYHFFYNFAKNNPQINFIIRPHQLLFSNSINTNFLAQEDLNEIFSKFRLLKNVVISTHKDRSLIEDVQASNIVISDGTSALAEVIVADKPIIYLSNGWNNEFNSNHLSREFKKYIYFAYDPNDITQYIENIRKNNYHPFREKKLGKIRQCVKYIKSKLLGETYNRNKFKKILDPVENPAKFIAEYVLSN